MRRAIPPARRSRTRALLGGVCLWAASAHAGETVEVTFEFHDPETEAVLLTGVERVTRVDTVVVKRTEYRSANGETTQTEDCRYDGVTLALEQYAFEDRLTGETATVVVEAGVARASYRKSADATLQTDSFPWTATSLSGKSIPDLIDGGWEQIAAGKAVPFELYVPFRLETIKFRAVRDADRSDGTRTFVRVEPRNWLLRQLAPAIAFVYEIEGGKVAAGVPPRLSRYEGPSMVDIDGEKNRRVRIRFR